jgi:ABC-type multidrug transport system fused ATPase/permease subunit
MKISSVVMMVTVIVVVMMKILLLLLLLLLQFLSLLVYMQTEQPGVQSQRQPKYRGRESNSKLREKQSQNEKKLEEKRKSLTNNIMQSQVKSNEDRSTSACKVYDNHAVRIFSSQ